jgi:hypothetical protein
MALEADFVRKNRVSFTDILTDFFSVIGTLFVVCYASPIIIAVVVPLIFIFFFIQVTILEK